MAKSVNDAFQEFNDNFVNLDSEETKRARKSRDWLFDKLENFPNQIQDFPRLYEGMHIKFGSFARNTKIRPLDDIDLILAFAGNGSTYTTFSYGKNYNIYVPSEAKSLRKLCNDGGVLNSIKLVNKIVSSLNCIEHYKSAEIHRRQEAAILSLSSYDWTFDIVPAFHTDADYYLIPDGSGGWKATDPRIDQNLVTSCNQNYNGEILQIVRILKYWNFRALMPTIPSYLFEIIIINYFNSQGEISKWIDFNLKNFWYHLSSKIYGSVIDPKKFQGDMNTLSYDEREKISEKSKSTYEEAVEAIRIEIDEKDQKKSINKWRRIFGNDFPKYI